MLASPQIRRCKFCSGPGVMIEDGPRRRLYECPECFAVEVISKGDGSWWYHGWQHPDGRAIDADGRHIRRDSYGWWDREGMLP